MSSRAAQSRDPAAAGPAEWRQHPERGSFTLLRIMAFLSLRLGRPAGRLILYAIAGYFFLFAPAARAHIRNYLRRALGREPRAADRFRLIMNFATVIHDRLYMLAGRYELFEISIQGDALMREIMSKGIGTFLVGAHMGSWEVLRCIGERKPGLVVAMAMYEGNARKLNAILSATTTNNPPEIIGLGQIDAMIQIHHRLERGAMVGLLGDRTLGNEPSLAVTFLGATAFLPTGPMRVAAALRSRVVFMAGLYCGGNRYQVVFEPLADFSNTPSDQTRPAIEAAITRYAALLEQHCRSSPYNWFNFFDFWRDPAAAHARSAPTTAASPTKQPQRK